MTKNRSLHDHQHILPRALPSQPVFTNQLLAIGAPVMTLVVMFFGCFNPRSSKDYLAMQAMGDKLRAYVMTSLDNMNAAGAQNVAVASSFFAREMECVAGQPPRLESTAPDDEPGKLRALKWGEYRARIESTILDPEHDIGGLTPDSYKTILGWALSKEDMSNLEAIRSRHGYWDKLSTALKN